jgi:two-component system, LytTR family, response regulator
VTPLRIIAVDDEPLARRRLERLLAGEPGVELLAVCGDGREAVEAVAARRPDLLLLDVQMPGLDGFAVLDELPGPPPLVVFVTAHDRYAVRAFDVPAVDYLLKPFDGERLRRALDRARERLRGGEPERQPPLGELLARLQGDRYLRRLLVRTGSRVQPVPVEAIDWVEATGNYLSVHAGRDEHVIRGTLGDLEAQLDPARFLRTHRSQLVNVDRVRELHLAPGGDYVITLTCGAQLKLSRGYRDRFFARMGRPSD